MRKIRLQSSPPFLSLEKATFRLGDRLVFENTNWTFRRGEQWAMTGPNGSGKSIFADAVRGALPLVGGDLRYYFNGLQGLMAEECIGHVAFEDRKASLHGTVVQSRWNSLEQGSAPKVSEFLSYEQVMSVNPFEVTDTHEKARAGFDRRSRDAIKMLGLERFLDRELLSLSNGESQKVHLARVLSLPLRLLILDEPFTGLDAASRAHCNQVLEHLMATPLRVLLITGRTEDLPRAVTHCLRLENCRIVASGPRRTFLKTRALQPRARVKRPRTIAVRVRTAVAAPLVQLKNVSVRYDKATILENVNWTVRAGESWALLGPNGSGKTTLLSLILGDNPQAYVNNVTVFGKRRGGGESVWEIKQHIGWVSPELHLHFDEGITCFQAVASGFQDTIGLFEPLSRAGKNRVNVWLDRFGLTDLAQKPLFALSAGLQRMVLLARALVKRPRLLILDEPCQGLDQSHRMLFIHAVDDLIRSGAETAIYVTHRLEEIPPSILRVLRLQSGRASQATL